MQLPKNYTTFINDKTKYKQTKRERLFKTQSFLKKIIFLSYNFNVKIDKRTPKWKL